MQIVSEKLLLFLKQASIEKRHKSQDQLNSNFDQEDVFAGDIETLNFIIKTADEIIDAIDRELSIHHSMCEKPQSYLDTTMLKFVNMGWTTERNDFPEDFSCTLTVIKPADLKTRTKSKIEFAFNDLEGNELTQVSSYTIPLTVTEGVPKKDF